MVSSTCKQKKKAVHTYQAKNGCTTKRKGCPDIITRAKGKKQMAIRKEMYEAIKEHIENYVDLTDYSSRYDLETDLNDDLWTDDSVTGNASGSYYCNTWKARESVLANMEYFGEAVKEFCTEPETVGNWFINEEWETMDVTIRCYLLGQVIGEVLDDMEEDLQKAFDLNK